MMLDDHPSKAARDGTGSPASLDGSIPSSTTQGEKLADMPATCRGSKPAALADTASDDATPCRRPGLPSVDGLAVTRATCRLQIDLADVATDRAAHVGERGAEGKWHRTCGGAPSCPACRLAEQLSEAARTLTAGMNAATRALWLADGATLDAFRAEHGCDPKGAEWPAPESVDIYRTIRTAAPGVQSNIATVAAQAVRAKWWRDRYNALVRETCAPPHYKRDQPIPVKASSVDVDATGERGRYLLGFTIAPGRHGSGREWSIPIIARDRRQARELAMLTEPGRVKLGDLRLEADRLRRGRWYARIAYTRLVEPSTGTITASINRGMRCLLAVHFDDGTERGEDWLIPPGEVEAGLARIESQRRSYQNQVRLSDRIGHGRARTLEPIEHLRAKGDRWRDSLIKRYARKIVTELVAHKVRRLVIEDFSGIRDQAPEKLQGGKRVWVRIQRFPFYRLQSRIMQLCQEHGIEVVQVASQNISRTCPACGRIDPESVDLRAHRFRCTNRECGYSRHLDIVAAVNVLRRGTVSGEPAGAQSGGGVRPKAGRGKGRKAGR